MSRDDAGRLHHVEINVSDLDASRAFWGWLLARWGYEEYQRWDDGTSWRLDSTYLVFVRTVERHLARGYHRGAPGLNHLAFHAPDRAAVDELTRALDERGVPVLYRDRHPYAAGPGYYAVFFEDPDRIKVEYAAPPEADDHGDADPR